MKATEVGRYLFSNPAGVITQESEFLLARGAEIAIHSYFTILET
jgi:hypothetical protein